MAKTKEDVWEKDTIIYEVSKCIYKKGEEKWHRPAVDQRFSFEVNDTTVLDEAHKAIATAIDIFMASVSTLESFVNHRL